MENNIYSVVSLQSFTVFAEYFIALSIIYILIVITLITYNSNGLMLQKAVSECSALILFMACYLMINDDLIALDFLSFNHSIINDYFSFITKLLVCFFSGLYFLFIADSLKEQKLTSFEYLIIILFAILGLMLMCSSNDLLITYLAIELSSLSFYVLASYKKTSTYSVEGGIKYFITGAVSSAFFLLGSSFIYGISGSITFCDFHDLFCCSLFDTSLHFFMKEEPFLYYNTQTFLQMFDYALAKAKFEDMFDISVDFFIKEDPRIYYNNVLIFLQTFDYVLVKAKFEDFVFPPLFDFSFLEVGFTLILFSLFIKLALAPFHLWSLDVYEGSPTSTTIFFAVITKLSIFVLLVRLCYNAFFSIKDCWQYYSLWVGVFSIFIGSFGGLKQRKLKTLMAYSSTSHMGYALLAMSSATYFGIQMVLFYMVIYMISGLCIWSIFLFLRLKRKNSVVKYNKELGDFALLRKSNMPISFALALTMFSLAGIPPLAGFFAKASVFFQLINTSSYLVALITILCSVVSTFYYIRIIKIIFFENLLVGKLYYPIHSEKTIILSFLIFSLIFLFINPTLLYLICLKVILTLSSLSPMLYNSF
jgi:NADH:ubiquinone oxidoreductase subunit 2 (subunit N)